MAAWTKDKKYRLEQHLGSYLQLNQRDLKEQGFGLLELLVTAALLLIIVATAAPNFKILDNPVQDGSQAMLGFFKQTRARAVSTTRAYVVSPNSANSVTAEFASSCASAISDGTTADDRLRLTLPNTTSFSDTTWSVCYSSRGHADSNVTATIIGTSGQSKTVEVFLGGAVRVQ